MNKRKLTKLLAIPFLAALLIIGIMSNVDAVTQNAANLMTVEGTVTEIQPDEYYSFKVSYTVNDETVDAWCTPSTTFHTLYQEGQITQSTRVLALIDIDTMTGTVFDSIPPLPEPEPEPEFEPEETEPEETEPEPEPEPEPVEEEDPEPIADPEPEPEPELDIPNGLELVSTEVGPTPDIVAPEGKVKLTVMVQPVDIEGVSMSPPPGVYFADEGIKLLFCCVVDNDDWEFAYWNLGMGADGSIRKTGVGYEHYIRVTLDRDIVVTAFLNELI